MKNLRYEEWSELRDREALGARLSSDEEETCRIAERELPHCRAEQEAWSALDGLLTESELSNEQAARLVDDVITGVERADSEITRPVDGAPDLGVIAGERGGAPLLDPGERFAHYTVLERIGVGGMGVVYSAYDPKLDRKIALKLLRHDIGGGSNATNAPARLLREAKAMAKLSHANVTHVYEADTFGNQVYIAFEYVEGKTLRDWRDDEEHSWSDTLEVFLAAGRGLEAAHAVGLVHRDFKPTNVLIGDGGQVRVTDFGLARLTESDAVSLPEATLSGPVSSADALTSEGTVMGTPRYMAPEQVRSGNVDARADQYAFCVALYEALYGGHPYANPGEDLEDALMRAEVFPPPKDSQVPAWLHKALLRGLEIDSARRYPGMTELIAALPPQQRSTWRWLAVAAGACVAMAVGGVTYGIYHQSQDRACTGAEAKIAEIWNDARRSAINAAFMSTEVPHARDAWERVQLHLDTYVGAWSGSHKDACEATNVRKEQSAALMDLRMACLDRHRQALGAIVDVLEDADAEVVTHAVEAVMGLPPVARCHDVDALQADVAPPDDRAVAEAVGLLRARLAHVKALQRAGKWAEAQSIARPMADEARAIGYAPLVAEVIAARGNLELAMGEYEEGEASLTEAAMIADGARFDRLAAKAKTSMVNALSIKPDRHDDALQWAEHARAAIARINEQGGRLDGNLSMHLAGIYGARAEDHKAVEHAQRAVEIFRRVVGPDDPLVAIALNNLGNATPRERAEQHYRDALEIWERVVGPNHPNVAAGLNNLALVYFDRHELALAREHLEKALSIWEAALGPDHPNVAVALVNLGSLYVTAEELERGRKAYERALESFSRRLGDDHPRVASVLDGLGWIASEQGRHSDAKEIFERSLAIKRKALGDDHPDIAATLMGLTEHHLKAGNPRKALQTVDKVIALADEHPERIEVEDALFLKARALWDSGRDRAQARALAEQARLLARQRGKLGEETLAETEAWLAKH